MSNPNLNSASTRPHCMGKASSSREGQSRRANLVGSETHTKKSSSPRLATNQSAASTSEHRCRRTCSATRITGSANSRSPMSTPRVTYWDAFRYTSASVGRTADPRTGKLRELSLGHLPSSRPDNGSTPGRLVKSMRNGQGKLRSHWRRFGVNAARRSRRESFARVCAAASPGGY